jgi:hypothetical protein
MLVFLIVWPWSLDWAEEVRGRELRFASQPAAEGRFCLVFGGTIALDDFLQGLQKRETQPVSNFAGVLGLLRTFQETSPLRLTPSVQAASKKKTQLSQPPNS